MQKIDRVNKALPSNHLAYKEEMTVKIVRRLIMSIAFISLLPNMISLFDFFKSDIPKEIRQQVKDGSAKQIDFNKEVALDQDKIIIKQLILSEKETLLFYEVHTKEPGWSFPDSALQLTDKQGKVFQNEGSSSSSNSWGHFGMNRYKRLPKELNTVVVDFSWYDRSFQIELPLEEER
jgi:hypothetical protein